MASSSSSPVASMAVPLGHPVTEKLTWGNFLLWKAQVLPAIRGAQMEGYIHGTSQAPPKEVDVAKERATRNEVPPPEDEGGADCTSRLPDDILGDIVSLLPVKQGGRTQILASRWRHLWRSAPLNIDTFDLPGKNFVLAGVVERILSAHPGPGRRFCVHADHECSAATLEAWLRSPALDNLQELEFCYVRHYHPSAVRWRLPSLVPPPASTFRFSATLLLASIGKCHLPDSTVQALHFPRLKHLALHRVRISECSLHSMIASCPALECLLIYCCYGFDRARINSLTLRSIGVRVSCNLLGETGQLGELKIESAPCLERLLRLDLFDGLHVSVISAPKLETSGYLYSGCHHRFSEIIQELGADSLTTVVRSVKILAVGMPTLGLDVVIGLMRCFPCLQKLYIQNESRHQSLSGPSNSWCRKHRKLLRSFDIQLKTIVFEDYQGIIPEVNFATFFVVNARVLELMTFVVETNNEEFIAMQKRFLQLENRASRGARFHFTTDRCLRTVPEICHVRDLDLTDPFVL